MSPWLNPAFTVILLHFRRKPVKDGSFKESKDCTDEEEISLKMGSGDSKIVSKALYEVFVTYYVF